MTFGADLAMCKDEGLMINTCAQLDESISFTPDVINEGDMEKDSFDITGSVVSTGNVVDIAGESCKGGEILLEDQDGFDSTPSCSQMPCVDLYKRKSDAGNVDSRYTALTHIFVLFLGLSIFSSDVLDKKDIKEEVKEEVKAEVKEEVRAEVKEEECKSDGADPNVIFKNWRQFEEGTKLER